MDDPEFSGKPWSDNPNAPQITSLLHLEEKEYLAGCLTGAIFYGIVIVLFFQCMRTLLSPTENTRGIKWHLVVHTIVMFSLVTVHTALILYLPSISYVDNRGFPGTDTLPPGPFIYLGFYSTRAIGITSRLLFPLNQWLADGLMLYRCYTIYSMNYRIIAFPSLIYIASLATGITLVYYTSAQPDGDPTQFYIAYFSICLSLNIVLTLMIVLRLVLHTWNVQGVSGSLSKVGKIYEAIVTIFIESCALYSISFLLVIGPLGSGSGIALLFNPVLTQTQVIAPFFIIQRAAKNKGIKNDSAASKDIGSIIFAQGATDENESLLGSDSLNPMGTDGDTRGGADDGTDRKSVV